MARSHSHSVKIGEGRRARRRKRQRPHNPEPLNVVIAVSWVCNDASCVVAHGRA
jgi:hypothetical protein